MAFFNSTRFKSFLLLFIPLIFLIIDIWEPYRDFLLNNYESIRFFDWLERIGYISENYPLERHLNDHLYWIMLVCLFNVIITFSDYFQTKNQKKFWYPLKLFCVITICSFNLILRIQINPEIIYHAIDIIYFYFPTLTFIILLIMGIKEKRFELKQLNLKKGEKKEKIKDNQGDNSQ